MNSDRKYSLSFDNEIVWCNYTGNTSTIDVIGVINEICALSTRTNWEYIVHNFDDVEDISLGVASIVAIGALGLARIGNEKAITIAVVTSNENFIKLLKITGVTSNQMQIFANSMALKKSICAERQRLIR